MLLLEADYNTSSKIIFNTRIILMIEERNDISYEIVEGKRSQSAMHIEIDKKLIANIAHQAKTLYAIVSADVSNCFDRVAYPISAIICWHFGL